jgi:hypothetical protein
MTIEEIEKRLRVLEDIEEIKKLHCHYVNCLTSARWDEAIDCFAENAVTDLERSGVTEGKANIAKLFKEGISRRHGRGEGAILIHPIITVDGDKARGNWHIYFMYNEGLKKKKGNASDWLLGEYNVDYVRESGKWKMALMKWRFKLGSSGQGNYVPNS